MESQIEAKNRELMTAAANHQLSHGFDSDETRAAFDREYQSYVDGVEAEIYDMEHQIAIIQKSLEKFPVKDAFASFWQDMSDGYDIDLDNYKDWESAKKDINQRLIDSLGSLADEYKAYIDFDKLTVDTEAMGKKGYTSTQISNLAANVSYAREMRDQMEAYFSGTVVITEKYADKIKSLYDIDISNCRSYLSAKKKILKQLALINADVFTINEDDGSGMLVTQDMIDDLIDLETGLFDGAKAMNKYHIGGEALTALEKMADAIKEIVDFEKELEEEYSSGDINAEKVADEVERLNKLLSDMLSIYDQVFAGIKAIANEQIDSLEKEKKALEDKNEEEKTGLELIKARQQLEDARRNKNVRVYYEDKGFVWEADQKAIQEAEENLKDKETDAAVSEIDKKIDAVNEYVDAVDKLTEDIDNEKSISVAMQYFGITDPEKLLELSPEVLVTLQGNYRNLSLENDKAENQENLATYSSMTDEQIREKFGTNFGMSIDSLRSYWNGTYFIPDTIKEFTETEKKALAAVADSKPTVTANDNKNYYIENINITYSGGSIEELIRDATRLSKNS